MSSNPLVGTTNAMMMKFDLICDVMHYRRFQPYYTHDHDLTIYLEPQTARRLTMEVCMLLL